MIVIQGNKIVSTVSGWCPTCLNFNEFRIEANMNTKSKEVKCSCCKNAIKE